MSKFKTNEEYFAFSKRLVVIPTEDILNLFKSSNIKLPSFVHRFLLKETIRDKVFEEKVFNTYTDELKYRLRGYDDFSIYLLEKLIDKYNLEFDITRYKELLFDFIFLNREILKVSKGFLNDLEQLQHNYTVDLEIVRYQNFIDMFKEVFYEVAGYIDGVKLDKWSDDVLTSYTLGDLKGLALKYNIKIPRRINKTILIEILKAKFELSDEEKEELAKNSVLEIELYAKEKGFNISIDLKKTDMIEFIKYSLDLYHKETYKDEFSYTIPLVSDVQAVKDDIVELEKDLTEVKEEVKEEKPIEVEEEIEDIEIPEIEVPEETPEEIQVEEQVIEPEEEKPVVEDIEPEPVPEPKPEPKPIIEKAEAELEKVEEAPRFSQSLDESLLSKEEKDLLDEKINIIIKKYYKKRRRRRIIWTILIVLLVAIVGFAVYSYIYYTDIDQGNLPFNIPVFWK